MLPILVRPFFGPMNNPVYLNYLTRAPHTGFEKTSSDFEVDEKHHLFCDNLSDLI